MSTPKASQYKLARLRSDVVFEPLWYQWYAWSYLIPPHTAARYLTHSQLPVMQSFVEAPQVHVDTLRDPEMIGGPFIAYGVDKAKDIETLVKAAHTDQKHLLALSDAIAKLEAMLDAHPPGASLEPLYQKLPAALKGFVELVYDARDCPAIRFIEALLYRSDFYRSDGQSISLRRLDNIDQRAFVLSTPRLDDDLACRLQLAFNDPRINALAKMRTARGNVNELAEQLNIDSSSRKTFLSLFTEEAIRNSNDYDDSDGDNIRIRYLGHACVLVESCDVSILVDPLIGYDNPAGIARHSYADLPSKIDYVLITHNHQDHVMFETLLQLRHKIGTVVIARGQKGSILDPSLKIILQQIGFDKIHELDELDSIDIAGGEIIGIPVLGEHGDLNIATKTAYWISLKGRSVVCAADSNNLDNRLYQHLNHLLGGPDMLFIGMECDGAPYNWSYGPFLPSAIAHKQAQDRRLDGSDSERGIRLVETMKPKQVYVYAMGIEPWLNYITSIHYTDESRPIIESDKLIKACRDRGLVSERMLGCRDFILKTRSNTCQQTPSSIPVPEAAYRELNAQQPQPVAAPRRETKGSEQDSANDEKAAQQLTVLLKQLGELNIRLWLDNDQLKVNAPKGALTAELTTELKAHKPQIITLLQGSPDPQTSATDTKDGSSSSEQSTWQHDVLLQDEIRPQTTISADASQAKNILLTGATGFLGAWLLRELIEQTEADIHCLVRIDQVRVNLVRADSEQQVMQRLEQTLSDYGLWQASYRQRIIPLPGDLSEEAFGLHQAAFSSLLNNIDLIVHNGARVHHGMPYAQLRDINVEGTRRMLRFACDASAPLNYISSLSVLPAEATAERSRFMETDSLREYPAPQGGYNLTKWVAERLVAEAANRGLPVSIFRPGPVSGDSQTGAFNRNDFLYRLMTGYVESGIAPDGSTLLDMLPVDFIARLIVTLSLSRQHQHKIYHLLHPQAVSSDILFDACQDAGYPIRRVPYDDWFRHLSEIARNDNQHALYPLVAMFSSRRGMRGDTESVEELPFDCSQAMAAIRDAGLVLPKLDKSLFSTYLSAMLAKDNEQHTAVASTESITDQAMTVESSVKQATGQTS